MISDVSLVKMSSRSVELITLLVLLWLLASVAAPVLP
jgi:hypothetical protein